MGTESLSLKTAVEQWDHASVAARLDQASAERTEFVERFPPSVWPEVDLADYALGQTDRPDAFSRWIEFRTPTIGSIKGGSAHKHLVYRRSTGDWFFEAKYGSVDKAWDAVRKGFAELVAAGADGRWSDIDQIEGLWAAPAVRGKTAWIYFPDQLLPIYSKTHLDYWLRLFAIDSGDLGAVGRNRLLLEELKSMPAFDGWSPVEIMFFLHSWGDPDPGHKILKIAPGEDARLWSECRDSGTIRLGWDEIADLTLFEGLDDLQIAYAAAKPGNTDRQVTHACKSLLLFRDLEEGDIVVANRGTKTVLGIGRVAGGYYHVENRSEYRHTVDVDWFDTTERTVDFGGGWRSTIMKVRPDQYHALTANASETGDDTRSTGRGAIPNVPDVHREAELLLKRSGQLVFYGPPGTGKTFTARRHAGWLLEGASSAVDSAWAFGSPSDLREILERRSDVFTTDERPAWLLVANPQYWSWDELFARGSTEFRWGKIARNYDEVAAGDVVYGYEATPTKAVVAKAEIGRGLHKDAEGYDVLTVSNGRPVDGPTWALLQNDPVLSQSEPVSCRMQGTLFRLEPHEVTRLELLLGGTQRSLAGSGVPQLTQVTFHPTYSYEDFIEGYKPTESGNVGLELVMKDGIFKRVCKAAAADPDRPYVVIIDEINRGNVPKIFGELITLIEADKRGTAVTLPQSGHRFVVPPNVHVIATMNTADRSIHVMDAALRRRFAFVELLPDPSVLAGAVVGSLPLDDLLRELNSRIREGVSRELQIGHAMFMNGHVPLSRPDEFALAMKYEVLPLLQEYVYGDYRQLANLLGEEVVDIDEQVPRWDVLNNPERLVDAVSTHLGIALT